MRGAVRWLEHCDFVLPPENASLAAGKFHPPPLPAWKLALQVRRGRINWVREREEDGGRWRMGAASNCGLRAASSPPPYPIQSLPNHCLCRHFFIVLTAERRRPDSGEGLTELKLPDMNPFMPTSLPAHGHPMHMHTLVTDL